MGDDLIRLVGGIHVDAAVLEEGADAAVDDFKPELAGDLYFQNTCRKLDGSLDKKGCLINGFYITPDQTTKKSTGILPGGYSLGSLLAEDPKPAVVPIEVSDLSDKTQEGVQWVSDVVVDGVSILAATVDEVFTVTASIYPGSTVTEGVPKVVIEDREGVVVTAPPGGVDNAEVKVANVEATAATVVAGSKDELVDFLDTHDDCQKVPGVMKSQYNWSGADFQEVVYQHLLKRLDAGQPVNPLDYLQIYPNLDAWSDFIVEKYAELDLKERSNEHVAFEMIVDKVTGHYWVSKGEFKDYSSGITRLRDMSFAIAQRIVNGGADVDSGPLSAEAFFTISSQLGDMKTLKLLVDYVKGRLADEETLEGDKLFYQAVSALFFYDLYSTENAGYLKLQEGALAAVRDSSKTPENVLKLL
ncbi:MAG: hypothetical protein HN337_07745 [Deltaproteobacteria bacterium]|jgi:hypothetical protein|nr:hypothetical protein [Deltaproteobacteria bacterium]